MGFFSKFKFRAEPHLTWHFSSDIKDSYFRPVIALIHNFGGTEEHFLKHVQYLNQLGFDAVTFDLSWHKNGDRVIFFRRIRKAWSKEIKTALTEILQKRDIIVFTFSGLGACTFDAVAELLPRHRDKIKSLIFDSGPFDEYSTCVDRMLEYYYGIKTKWLRSALTKLLVFAWDPENSQTTRQKIAEILKLKPELPVLSIEGARDKIVPIAFIQNCFEMIRNTSQHFTQVIFELGGHLTSFKEEPAKYKATLRKFLFG